MTIVGVQARKYTVCDIFGWALVMKRDLLLVKSRTYLPTETCQFQGRTNVRSNISGSGDRDAIRDQPGGRGWPVGDDHRTRRLGKGDLSYCNGLGIVM